MVPEILDHVPDRIRHFPQRLHDMCVEAICEYLSDPSGDPVEGAREANREPLDGAREHRRVIGLDDEVQMVPLNRVVHDPHSKTQLDLTERILDGASAAVAAQKSHAR
jgi:hypothetical protein